MKYNQLFRRNIVLFAMALAVLSLSSCSGDKDDDEIHPIVGTWKLDFDASDATITEYVVQTYNEDNTGEYNHYRPEDDSFIYKSTIEWTITDNQISTIETFGDGTVSSNSGTFFISGDVLTLDCEGCEPITLTRQ